MKKTVCRLTLLGMLFLGLIMPMNTIVLAGGKTFQQILGEAKSQITEVTVEQVKKDMDASKEFVLLDVRCPDEYEAGHLPKAVNIPRGKLEFMIARLYPNKDTEMVLYCRTGGRSALCTKTLMDMGYTNVKNFNGAFKAWGTSGYPIFNRHGEFKMIAFEKKE
jgi:rhodanese-related sulfurtransferase